MKPVILLGAARSGTTFLGRYALSHHNQVNYWGEPNHVWMHGHAYRSHDCLSSADANPRVVSYIRKRFSERAKAQGGVIVLEKTPSNCLRVPFIREVFPDAKFVHLVRDGRDVIRSAVKEWQGTGTDALDSKELREGSGLARVGKGTRAYCKLKERVHDFRDLVELPAYLPRFVNFVRRNVQDGGDFLWGPRFPEMRSFRTSHSLSETCAEQWRWQVDSVLENWESIDPEQRYEMRFEQIMQDPRGSLNELIDWLALDSDTEWVEAIASSVKPRSSGRNAEQLSWIEDESERSSVSSILEPVLKRLEYI